MHAFFQTYNISIYEFNENKINYFDDLMTSYKEIIEYIHTDQTIPFLSKVNISGWLFENAKELDMYIVTHDIFPKLHIFACIAGREVVEDILQYLKSKVPVYEDVSVQESTVMSVYQSIRQSTIDYLIQDKNFALSNNISLYTAYLEKNRGEDISLGLSELKVQVVSVISEFIKDTEASEQVSDIVDEILNLFAFYTGVKKERIYYLVRFYGQTENNLLFSKKFVDVDTTEEIDIESVTTDDEKIVSTQNILIQKDVINTFGDITTLPVDNIEPVLQYLQQRASEVSDPTITELIYFDTSTNTFVWNEDLLSNS